MNDKVTVIDIVNLCKCEVSINIDSFTISYLSIEDGLSQLREYQEVDEEIIREMRDYGHIVEITAYPRTPVGSVTTYGGSLPLALDRMYAELTEEDE
jgi:hypothetical protein